MAIGSTKRLRELLVETDMADPLLMEFAAGSVVALCRRCPGKTEPNDDSAAVVQAEGGALVLAVADGVGAYPLGYKASAIAVASVVERVERAPAGDDLRAAILDAIESANREILQLGSGAASTLAVVHIQERVFRAYQVGDCMTLVVGQRGAMKWKSISHSPVGYGIESGLLDEQAAMTHDERHIVSNVVGSQDMHIEIGPVRRLAARDRVLIGSDGLFDNLHLSEIVAYTKHGPPREKVAAMSGLATTRMSGEDAELPGKPDDLTVLLYAAKPDASSS